MLVAKRIEDEWFVDDGHCALENAEVEAGEDASLLERVSVHWHGGDWTK